MDATIFIKLVEESYSKNDLCKKLGYHNNSNGYHKINELILLYNADISHFDAHHKTRKYKIIKRECPICHTLFTTKVGSKDEKITCSRGCANTYFLSGNKNPRYKGTNRHQYQKTCFEYHEYKCCVCNENKIIEVHHLDGNRQNNIPENLVPLCPTHHKYFHSRYRHLILNKIKTYMKSVFNTDIHKS